MAWDPNKVFSVLEILEAWLIETGLYLPSIARGGGRPMVEPVISIPWRMPGTMTSSEWRWMKDGTCCKLY